MKNMSAAGSIRTIGWMVLAGALGVGLGPLIARATAAGPGPASLAFAGSLWRDGMPVSGSQRLGFTFKKGGAPVCSASDLAVTPDDEGQFTVAIPIAACPSSLFDGSEVKLDISVGGDPAVVDQPITSVPSAKFAEQVGYPDCPSGYDRASSATSFVFCRRGMDEIVRVGTRATAFWIDRYEASIWNTPDGSGKQFGIEAGDYPTTAGGQPSSASGMYAVSRSGVRASAYLTWFQANVACRQAGKRLPTSEEWLMAAEGTPDSGLSDGTTGHCNTQGSVRRVAGTGTICASASGAQDMIGNLFEWNGEWQAAPSAAQPAGTGSWGPGWSEDAIGNVASGANTKSGTWSEGFPAATVRGGSFSSGNAAGVFTYSLGFSPTYADAQIGVRCVVPR